MISFSRSSGRAGAKRPFCPFMSSAAVSAFRIASSVASAAARKSGVIWSVPSILRSAWSAPLRTRLAVEKARKMSPLELAPIPPAQASPVVARRARRWHWIGSSGASVARMTMIELLLSVSVFALATSP